MNKHKYFIARWHEDPRYSVQEAVAGKLYASEKVARRMADRLNEREPELGRFGYVVRSVRLA